MRKLLPLSLLVWLSGCGSSEPQPEARPAPTAAATPAQPASRVRVSGSAPAPAAPARAAGGARLPAGHVMFTVERRPLDEVLRIFEDQVGLRIAWRGEPRPVSLRLSQPMRWEDALSLVCQFTRTHLARDYQGRYQLKDGWGGSLGTDDDVDALLKEQGDGVTRAEGSAPGGRVTAGSGGRAAGGTTTSAGGAAPTRYNESGAGGLGKSTMGDAYSGGDTARGLLKGVSNTSSGPR